MSEGRIPVSGLDIRHLAIRTPHVVDGQVTTAKIADVAVTVEKTNEPDWVVVAQAPSVINTSLTTSFIEMTTTTVEIPAWVGVVSMLVICTMQMSNTSGGVQGMLISPRVNDLPAGEVQHSDVASGGIGVLTTAATFAFSTPGASIDFSTYGRVSSGTNSGNLAKAYAILIGDR